MEYLALILILLLYTMSVEVFHHRRQKELEDRYYKERRELIDRVMARDFTQYKQAEVLEKTATTQVPVQEDDMYSISDIGV